jgi:hypothetical protein
MSATAIRFAAPTSSTAKRIASMLFSTSNAVASRGVVADLHRKLCAQ